MSESSKSLFAQSDEEEVREVEVSSKEEEEEEAVKSDEDDEMESIRAAFTSSVNDEDEDSVKMQMIQAGATFKNVTRLYNQFMIDAGLAISKSDRAQIVEDTLEGLDLDTEESFNEAVAALMESVTGSTERSAGALVRSYAKKNDIPVYVKPKESKGTGSGRSGFIDTYHKFLIDNPNCTKEEATAYINGEGDHPDTSDNVKKHISHYLKSWKLVNKIINK